MDLSNILVFLVGVIFLFAIFDLIVWVSNDAINFLSPSVGSKAGKYKTILIVAGLWLLIWAIFSSGMMEVARKGIFHPEYFTFFEITLLFLSVIVADILLLDRFNSMGLPTSTTVSIVFCLLWWAVWVGVIKISNANLPLNELATYINTAKVLTIILGILSSVVASFLLWSIVQYIVRLFFTFDYEKKPKFWAAILWAIAITVITHFILVKWLKSSALPNYKNIISWVQANLLLFLWASLVVWSIILQLLLSFRVNVFKLIVLIGTFSLAMAFAGNDLVNFIWVPLAALKSYLLFNASGLTDPNAFYMNGLNAKEKANTLLLIAGWVIMVLTIIFSKKAKWVLRTGLDLSRQDEGKENFGSSLASRVIVRNFINITKIIQKVTPKKVQKFMSSRFEQVQGSSKEKTSFDFIRASVILICSSILISIATAYKLPLSTTYVTFMVAMGAAFADKSWGRESAVYRVNGVLTVIVWWFLTAFWAFLFAFTIANIIYFWGTIASVAIIILTVFVMSKPLFGKSENETSEIEISQNTFKTLASGFHSDVQNKLVTGQKYYTAIIQNLEKENLSDMKKLNNTIWEFKDYIYEYKRKLIVNIGNINDKDMKSLSTYVWISNSTKTYAKALKFISDIVTEYMDNNHVFAEEEIKNLKNVNKKLAKCYKTLFKHIETKQFTKSFTRGKELVDEINDFIEDDIKRVQNGSVDAQSSILYISILNETKYLLLELVAIYRRLWEL